MCVTSIARNNGLISAAKETFGMSSPYNSSRLEAVCGGQPATYSSEAGQPRRRICRCLGLLQLRLPHRWLPSQLRSSSMLGGYRFSRRFCARGDGTVKAVREKASLFHPSFPSKREVKHLSSRPGRDQTIAVLDGEDLLCLSAGRRDQVHAVQRCRWNLQSRNLCSYSGSMLRLSPQKACRRRNDVRSLKKTGRTRIRCHADVL